MSIRFNNGYMLVFKSIIKQKFDNLPPLGVSRFGRSKPMSIRECLTATLRTFQLKMACALIIYIKCFLTLKTNLLTHC